MNKMRAAQRGLYCPLQNHRSNARGKITCWLLDASLWSLVVTQINIVNIDKILILYQTITTNIAGNRGNNVHNLHNELSKLVKV